MATALDINKSLEELEATLVRLANEHAECDVAEELRNLPITRERARVMLIQRNYFMLNRRDCWGYVQAKSPLPVKKLIWDHEQEELMGNKETGKEDHIAMNMREGEALGMTVEDFYKTPPSDGTLTCMMAWHQLASESPWLMAFAASSALELSNSNTVVKKGAPSGRMADKINRELGIPTQKLVALEEHRTADVEHGNLMMQVARMYADTPDAIDQILTGARKSWAIDKTNKAALLRLVSTV